MSSRTPAPEEPGRFAMPDLPGEFFGDDDPIYAPVDPALFARDDIQEHSWDDSYPGYVDEEDVVVERPHRRRRPARDFDGEFPERRRSSRNDEFSGSPLVRFETGTHGTPIRMTDWRDILNWMLAR